MNRMGFLFIYVFCSALSLGWGRGAVGEEINPNECPDFTGTWRGLCHNEKDGQRTEILRVTQGRIIAGRLAGRCEAFFLRQNPEDYGEVIFLQNLSVNTRSVLTQQHREVVDSGVYWLDQKNKKSLVHWITEVYLHTRINMGNITGEERIIADTKDTLTLNDKDELEIQRIEDTINEHPKLGREVTSVKSSCRLTRLNRDRLSVD